MWKHMYLYLKRGHGYETLIKSFGNCDSWMELTA